MSAYVYRVLKDTVMFEDSNGVQLAHVVKYAYKPYWNNPGANHKMHFKTGCYSKPKLIYPLIAMVSEEKDTCSIYKNEGLRSWVYDDSIDYVGQYKWDAIKEVYK